MVTTSQMMKLVHTAKMVERAVSDSITSSTKWVESLDRSPLGKFVIPTHALAVGDAIYSVKTGIFFAGSMPDFTNIYRGLYALLDDADTEPFAVEVELSFWRDKDIALTAREIIGDVRKSPAGRMLAQIASSPAAYHEYFNVGIFDMNVIESLMADGIDAELAAKAAL